ncbi:hypothetical protein A8A54_21180 [Brucella pseudogrignonensis]|nr:hypothetical protein A8A54_21180 [Brucella pseudogrignonensis]EMG51247.1 hypothetical protein WYI_23350 [Ochrobactrum sp. CDB2]
MEILGAFVTALLLSSNANADVSEGILNYKFPNGILYNHVRLSGEISESDLKYIRMTVEYFKSQNYNPLFLELNAHGTNIYPAMKIGKIVKEEAATVGVTEKNDCIGTCIYVLAAGTRRYYSYMGTIAVMYPDEADVDGNTAYEDSLNYFAEMRVSDMLAGHIFNADRLDDRALDKHSLALFELGTYGQELKEQKDQEWADKIGMPIAEFREKKINYDQESSDCQVLRDGMDCWAKVAKKNDIWYPGINDAIFSQ